MQLELSFTEITATKHPLKRQNASPQYNSPHVLGVEGGLLWYKERQEPS